METISWKLSICPWKKNQNFYLCTFTSSNKLDSRDQSVTKALSSKGNKLMAFAHKWNFLVEIWFFDRIFQCIFLFHLFFPQIIIISFLICLQIEQDWNDVFGKKIFTFVEFFCYFKKKNWKRWIYTWLKNWKRWIFTWLGFTDWHLYL